jgi:cobalt-zinc-cadmium efflux system outer membrane protein
MARTNISRFSASFTPGRLGAIILVTLFALAKHASAQGVGNDASALEALLARADSVNPSIQAARNRAEAARARIGPAASWADPQLMAGILNLPLGSMQSAASEPVPGEPMTMKMVGISQTIPYPGKLALRRQSAEHDALAVAADLAATRLDVERGIRGQYFEIFYLDKAIEIAERNRSVLGDVVQVTEAHYAAGTGAQQDVLKARVDAARLGLTTSDLLEQRRSVLAELNSQLDRESSAPVATPAIPQRIASAAIETDPSQVRFTSQSLGARAAGSPLPPLSDLQDLAVKQSPLLRASEARLQAQAARVSLARKESRPDFDLSLQYGQRNYRPDMISAQVSVPIPLHRGSRQGQQLAEARAELSAMEMDRRAQTNSIRARVARLVSDLERERTELALYAKAILPQSAAAATASLASYQSGKTGLLGVLDNQNTLFGYQTAYYRAFADFAKSLAELEQVVAGEILR